MTGSRLLLWGESAIPHLLVIFWFLENFSGSLASDRLLLSLIRGISAHNGKGSLHPLPDPYQLAEEALAEAFSISEHGNPRNKAADSYALESLVLLAAKRLLRQNLAAMWSQVTRVEMASFHPDDPADLLLWRCDAGQERHRWPNHPESWSALKALAALDESASLPTIFREHPSFALMFFLAFPHRVSTPFVKMLDVWLK